MDRSPHVRFEPPLRPATLIQRYKRFFVDVRLEDGTEATAHVANGGKMLGVDAPGSRVWLAPGAGRLAWSVKFVETATSWAGVDTGLPNKMIKVALAARALKPFAAYEAVRPEAAYGRNSRIDFLLTGEGLPPLYLEVKNCHLSRAPRLAEFPDCVAARSSKHMAELADMVREGARAAVVFTVQRTDCDRFTPAADLDPGFAAAARAARDAGVEFYAYRCAMSPHAASVEAPIAVSV